MTLPTYASKADMLAERADILQSARVVLDGAKAANRDLTTTEQDTLQAKMTRVELLDRQVKGRNLVDSIRNLGTSEDAEEFANGSSKSLFNDTDRAGFVNAARTKGSFGTTVALTSTHLKAATLAGGLLPTSGTEVSGMPPGLGAYPLRNLFAQAAADGPVVRFYRMGPGTAGVVAEGALKPDAGIVTTQVDAPLVKIAGTFQVSDELAEDGGFLISAIQREATLGVLVKENQQIVSTLTATSGTFTGTGAAADVLDVVATAVGGAEARDGITPSALVANPVDVAGMRKLRATAGGTYILDPMGSAPSTVHGVPLVSSSVTPAGTMWLLSAGAGVFYTRGGLRVDSGYNGDDWQRNLITYRCEERVLPAIVRPGLVTKLTLT